MAALLSASNEGYAPMRRVSQVMPIVIVS